MIGYCPTAAPFFIGNGAPEVGISDEADRVKRQINESLEHYLQPQLEQLIPEIKDAAESSQTPPAISVDSETVTAAIEFSWLLPRFAPMPEVSADPDGEISFDWIGPAGRMFSVSVNKSRRLAYAGWFGEDSKVHGTEKLADSFPQAILRGVQRTMR